MSSRYFTCLLAGILLSFLLAVTASSKDVGEGKDDMLVGAASQLDRHHIDVRMGVASTAAFEKGRAILARLDDFPIEDAPRVANPRLFSSGFLDVVFKRVHESGGRHLLLVMPDITAPRREWPSFQAWKWNVWYQAPPTKRFFISYTAANTNFAEKVRTAFGELGYQTFMNRRTDGDFATSPRYVAEMFRTAGNHLVIDTPEARQSDGLRIEAQLLHSLVHGSSLVDRMILVGEMIQSKSGSKPRYTLSYTWRGEEQERFERFNAAIKRVRLALHAGKEEWHRYFPSWSDTEIDSLRTAVMNDRAVWMAERRLQEQETGEMAPTRRRRAATDRRTFLFLDRLEGERRSFRRLLERTRSGTRR